MTKTATKPKPKTTALYTPELRDWLSQYRADTGRSNGQIAKQLGTNPTAVSKYLSGKPEGNIPRLEALVADLRKAVDHQIDSQAQLFKTSATRQVDFVCELARKTNDIGIIHSPAGLGKTSGVEMYKQNNPLCLDITLSVRHRNDAGVERLVFNRLDARGWAKFHGDRWAYLIERLAKSNRLLLLDNAHRLTKSGLRWVFDFHDATNCPVVMLGNPELLDLIEADDQQFSRVGPYHELRLKEIRATASRLVDQYLPGHTDALADLAETVASHRGHLRALRKQLVMTRELMTMPDFSDPEAAFRAAHTKLIRHYQL